MFDQQRCDQTVCSRTPLSSVYLYADVSAIEFDSGANVGSFVKTSVVVEPNNVAPNIYTFNTKYFSSIRHVRIKHSSKGYFK